MRSHKVDLGLGNGSHADLVEGTCKESRKGAAEDNVPVTAGHSDSHTANILLGNEALHIAIREGILVGQGEGGVFGVSIESHDAIVVLAELHQSISIHLTGGNLTRKNELEGDLPWTGSKLIPRAVHHPDTPPLNPTPYLVSKLVVWWLAQLDFGESEVRSIVHHSKWLEAVVAGIHDGLLTGIQGSLGLSPQGLAVPVLQILNVGESPS